MLRQRLEPLLIFRVSGSGERAQKAVEVINSHGSEGLAAPPQRPIRSRCNLPADDGTQQPERRQE